MRRRGRAVATSRRSDRRTLVADGLGDLALVGVYRFYRRDVERGTTQASVLAGLKLPTGFTDIEDSDLPRLTGTPETRLPPSLQLGSGSVDGISGLATFHNRDRLSFYADVQGKLNTEGAQDFQAGNTLFYEWRSPSRCWVRRTGCRGDSLTPRLGP